jgi:hypothetical protein
MGHLMAQAFGGFRSQDTQTCNDQSKLQVLVCADGPDACNRFVSGRKTLPYPYFYCLKTTV